MQGSDIHVRDQNVDECMSKDQVVELLHRLPKMIQMGIAASLAVYASEECETTECPKKEN